MGHGGRDLSMFFGAIRSVMLVLFCPCLVANEDVRSPVTGSAAMPRSDDRG